MPFGSRKWWYRLCSFGLLLILPCGSSEKLTFSHPSFTCRLTPPVVACAQKPLPMKNYLFQPVRTDSQNKSDTGGGKFHFLFGMTPAGKVLPALLLLFTLTAFFSCSKSDVANVAAPADREDMVSISKTEDGLLNVVVTRDPADPTKADERDNECTFYEAMRFTEVGSSTFPSSANNRVYVDVEFRLILVNKSTLARTPLGSGSYTTITNVGGLNLTWVGYTPLTTHWYAVEFNTCDPVSYVDDFWIVDFWADGDEVPDFHLDPWSHADASGYGNGGAGGYNNTDPDRYYTQCTLNNDCSVSP